MVTWVRNVRNSWWRCHGKQASVTLPVATSRAANSVVVPVADVAVDLACGQARAHRQRRLGAVEGLDLARRLP